MKTSSSIKTPKQYFDSLKEPRKSELLEIDKLIQKTIKLKPFIMKGMLAYGPYHYKYASGTEGDWVAVALASQKNYISLYACMADGHKYVAESYKKKLPKASIGKSCVRFRKFSDVDPKIIQELLLENHALYKKLYGNQKSSSK